MSKRRRIKKRKSRKRLAYGVIAVTFILLCFITYFSLHQSNKTPSDHTTPPQAAIVDHLNFTGQPNPIFVNACINILDEGGLTWKYYRGEDVTVDFYRNLPSYGTSLIILRVHSAIMRVNDTTPIHILGLFTSERYYSPIDAYTKYPEDVKNDRLVEAFFSPEERAQGISYFGIVPKFIEKSMNGKFNRTIIIMMGCEGLGYDGRTYTDMAKAFVKKGAKVYISWNGKVGVNHTDQATVCLLQHLISKKQNIGKAIEETREEVGTDPDYKSILKFYPDGSGNYAIPNLSNSLTMNVAYTSPTPKEPTSSKYTAHE